ncbi:MAG: folate family ECF transporter S component [Clostridia bacterium]|nr:folate family ECF transporter S component [Clostridia bacterium]
MYNSPFSRAFWRDSLENARSLKTLVICALCMAMSIILGYFYIPITESLSIRFTYLATSTVGLVAGPVAALIYGAAVDLLDFMMHPGYTFFFGYTLSAMVGAFFYAIFYYRQRITILRIVLCRLCVNLIVNVVMGAYWSNMLYGKGFIYRMTTSFFKNIIMLPIEVIITIAFFSLLLPAFKSARYIPADQNRKITWF